MQAEPKYTAAEILEAGRRAEVEGRTEYAVQFYRHVVSSFAGTPDAAIAAAGLARLGATRPRVDRHGRPVLSRSVPSSRHAFRAGRLIAVLIECGGCLALALAVARVAVPDQLAGATHELARAAIDIPLELLITRGLAAILIGEGLRALFAGANAVRELVALARENVGGRQR
jgi:hypothetical protein